MTDKIVGILGGGQLGRMLGAAASLLNIQVIVLDKGTNGPAKQILSSSAHIDGAFTDADKIALLASQVDVLTVEIEHVNADALDAALVANAARNLQIHPAPSTIRLIQDKLLQKRHLTSRGLPVSPFMAVEPVDDTPAALMEAITLAAQTLQLPLMLKARIQAYDGRGNFVVRGRADVEAAMNALSGLPLYAEKWVSFKMEIAVMVVRSANGEVKSYPAVETVQKDNVCHLVFAPLRSAGSVDVQTKARNVAEKAVATLQGAGVFGVEMFLMNDGEIFINEIAPRPHNSGHYTIEACESSQYDNHLRAILSLPLGSTALKVPSTAMLNIMGVSTSMEPINKLVMTALKVPGANVHLYGKSECRKGRKMGHITIVGDSDATVRTRLRPLLLALAAAYPSEEQLAKEIETHAAPPPLPGHSSAHPLISIIMGSDSDLPFMLPATQILGSFFNVGPGTPIPYELTIVSAHRTPDRLISFARTAASRGVRVIIAGAGGAAHLPGMVAAVTALPVIGVPIDSKSVSGGGGGLGGMDALYSIVQMPRGIPVATVAINNSTNAALLALRILGSGVPHLIDAMAAYLRSLESEVMHKVDTLQSVGWVDYGKK